MIIYCSKDKISNLVKEKEINGHHLFFDITELKLLNLIDIKLCRKSGKEMENNVIQGLVKEAQHLNSKSNLLIGKYIKSSGYMRFLGLIDGEFTKFASDKELRFKNDISFFGDDILNFEIEVEHNDFDKIQIKCTASNIETFGFTNWGPLHGVEVYTFHPNSSDPGILDKQIQVEFIVWITGIDEENRTIYGSPIQITC